MRISAREAAFVLEVQAGLSRERARRVLTVFWARRADDVTEPLARRREVATVCGFVTLGADVTAVTVRSTGSGLVHDLSLEEPGPWFDLLRDRRVPSQPGRAWSVRGWQPYAQHRSSRRG